VVAHIVAVTIVVRVLVPLCRCHRRADAGDGVVIHVITVAIVMQVMVLVLVPSLPWRLSLCQS